MIRRLWREASGTYLSPAGWMSDDELEVVAFRMSRWKTVKQFKARFDKEFKAVKALPESIL